MTTYPPAEIPTGRRIVDGVEEIGNSRGGWTPIGLAKAQDLLQDEVVRKVLGHAMALSEQIARFKQHTFDDIGAFEALLFQEYGAKVGGEKGNMTFTSYDGLFQIKVQVADNIVFGPELQVAKALVDECLNEWASGARDEIRAIVTRAFNTDKAGQINRSEIFMLLRLEIADPRWQAAMKAIRDAMRVEGSKTYVRCFRRDSIKHGWEPVTIDLAKA